MADTAKKVVLVVDDEELFLDSIVHAFTATAKTLTVLTARNGRFAAEVLEREHVDLVVTDLNMPELDGFELIALISRQYPAIPVIVMTAFGTPDIERELAERAVVRVVDKPVDLARLVELVQDTLRAGTSGHFAGIGLATFLQLVEMERKTCTVRVRAGGREGELYLRRGALAGAHTSFLEGAAAATEIVCWEHPEIDLLAGPMPKLGDAMLSISEILMNAFRLFDERRRDQYRPESERVSESTAGAPEDFADTEAAFASRGAGGGVGGGTGRGATRARPRAKQREENIMSANEKLKELAAIDGFQGAAAFTPKGELLASYGKDLHNLEEVGILANNVLMNAQKASIDMGTGRGQVVHVEAETANIVVRCLNEGTDPIASQPGKAHIHLVLVTGKDAPIGLAKLKVAAIAQKLADDFRI